MKHPSDGAVFGHVAAVLVHHVPELADNAIAVRGHHLYENAHAAGAIALKGRFLVLLTFKLSRAARECPFDVVVGHVFILGRKDRSAQARVESGSPPPTLAAMVISRI